MVRASRQFTIPLDTAPYFGNYRTMEQRDRQTGNQAESSDSMLTDAVLAELKRQSENGCVLCTLEDWDEEDWD